MAVLSEVTLAMIEYLCLLLSLSGCILLKFDGIQPKPYMDEIFHIPQAQKYCDGKFMEWDPMITTLPGLYMISVGILRPAAWLFDIPVSVVCSPFWLRSINVMFTVGNVFLLRLLFRKLHQHDKTYTDAGSLMNAMALGLLPVLQFFTFLYYTDCGSTHCVLLMYLLSLHGNHMAAALTGMVAVLFRQTNIVWVVFVAGASVVPAFIDLVQPEKKEITEEQQQSPMIFLSVLKQISVTLQSNWKALLWFVKDVAAILWPYLFVVIAFIVFIVLNGGIVVGAKDDHQVSLHLPQLFYFCSFSAVSSFMYLITLPKILDFLRFLVKHPLVVFVFSLTCALIVWKFTFAHRYLLADNRHYPFYLWAKVYQRHELVKYGLVPCYLYGFWSMSNALQQQNGLWKIIFWVSVSVNLIPQMLLEFRYFIIPYIIFRLHMKMGSYFQMGLEIIFNLAINAFTLYLFIEKPFNWGNSSELQRFMW